MRAMVLEGFKEDFRKREVEEKELKPGDVKVKVEACGVCGSDLKIKAGLHPVCREISFPHILGHEVAGTVLEKGADVRDYNIGDRVVVSFYAGCGECEACTEGEDPLCESLQYWEGFRDWGGYAEYVVLPARALNPLDDRVPFIEAAIIPDAAATTYKAVKRIAGVKTGDKVMIIGAGGLGLHGLQIAKHLGAEVVVMDKDQKHLEKAEECGADIVIKPDIEALEKACQALGGGKLDKVIDLVGVQSTFDLGLERLKRGGKMVIVGHKPGKVCISPLKIIQGQFKIMGSRNCSKQDIAETIKLIADKKIKPVVKTAPLWEVNTVHQQLEKGEITGRVVLTIPED